ISMAQLWRDQGKRDEAYNLIAPVYGWSTEGFDTCDLKEAKALLDELASRMRETRWRGYWPWPVHHSRHRRQATFRVYRGRQPARRVHRGPNSSDGRAIAGEVPR